MNARREAGDHDQHGVAEHVAVEHAALGQALGARGETYCLLIWSRNEFLVSMRQAGEAADHQRRDRQRHVPEVVGDPVPARTSSAPVVGDQAAQREPVEVAAAGEQHDQQDGEQEARDRVADDDDRRWSRRRSASRRAPPWRCRAGSRSDRRAASSTARARSRPASSRAPARPPSGRGRSSRRSRSAGSCRIISRKRSGAGLSKPNCFSSSSMNCGIEAAARRDTCWSPLARRAALRAAADLAAAAR